MKISTKAAIYSAFVFPGTGYYFVCKKTQGIITSILTLAAIIITIVESFHKANIIAEKIVNGTIGVDMISIREQFLVTPGYFDPMIITGAMSLIVAVWVIGTIDSYRLGRIMESNDTPKTCHSIENSK